MATLAIVVVVVVLTQRGVNVGNLGAILLMPIIASVLLAGTSSGAVSTGIALTYYIAHHTVGSAHQFGPVDLEKVVTTALILPATVLLVGRLRHRLDAATANERALRIEADAERDRAEGTLESITDTFFAVDGDWCFVYLNKQFEQLANASRAELLGRSFWATFPSLVGSEWERELQRAFDEGEATQFEAYYPPLASWYQVHVYPAAEGLSIYLNDVTTARRAEASLAVRLRQQAAVTALGLRAFESDDLDAVMHDVVTVIAETLDLSLAKILLLTDGGKGKAMHLRAGTGWHAGVVGRHYDIEELSQAFVTLEGGEPIVVENFGKERRFSRPGLLVTHGAVGGMSVLIGDRTAPLGVLGVHSTKPRSFSDDDVVFLQAIANILATTIQREAARRELSQSEQKFRTIAENLPAVLLLLDLAAAKVLYVSPAYERMAGQPGEALYRDPNAWLRQVHPDDRARLEAANAAFLEHGSFDEVCRIATPAGLRWIHGRMLPIAVEDGRPTRAVGILRDITVEKLAQDNAARLAAAQAGNQARDEILAIVSHDLRSPLQTIKLAADVLATSGEPNPVRTSGVNAIRNAAGQMGALIEDLLDVARLEAGRSLRVDVAPLDVGGLLDDVRRGIAAQAERKGVVVDAAVEPGAEGVQGDRARLRQVLTNLLDNALKFTAAGGHIHVNVGRESDGVVVSVRDSGCGIDADQLPHLFDRYWQVEADDRRGVGLGLAICKGIVEAHGGHIWAESTRGVGTTVRFTLPAAAAQAS